jgi:hypothetical protein
LFTFVLLFRIILLAFKIDYVLIGSNSINDFFILKMRKSAAIWEVAPPPDVYRVNFFISNKFGIIGIGNNNWFFFTFYLTFFREVEV